ncbi:MAG: restriction endonuclease subunit S [Acidobacteria bacterium]|nr:restriction endonuclease subunit S [Acidobacteriota bacterium]MBV9478995.1 restriction endonuclease subunit S [Acidobacteriota bacterium]
MKGDSKQTLLPKLRFPEFREEPGWTKAPLRAYAMLVKDRVGAAKCTPYTVTSGVGLVSQQEKFGRTIAGNSFKNYLRLKKNDFAYNKSATKAFPQGYIARYLHDDDPGAVPNSIFTCFRVNESEVDPTYLDYLFASNLHGRWLKTFLTVGARAHGSLNVRDYDLLALPVPLPRGKSSLAEQQKIANCLTSLDEVIAAHGRKLEILQAHKKGLMQQLFPRAGETLPSLRFPEFRDKPEWSRKPLGDLFETGTGGTPDRAIKEYWGGGIPWITTSLVDGNVIRTAEEFITEQGLENSSAKLFPAGTVLIALYGQGKTRGKVAILEIEATTNQACAAVLPLGPIDPTFTFLSLGARYEELRALSNSGGQENLSQRLIRALPFSYPDDRSEQEKIVGCLSSLDDLVAAQVDALTALKTHKVGLMQQLFPSPERT